MGTPAVAPEPSIEPTGTRPGRLPHRTSRRRRLADRAARFVVTMGGFAIIAGILGILLFIVVEIWPLFGGARVRPAPSFFAAGVPIEGLIGDEHRTVVATVGADGVLRVIPAAGGRVQIERPAVPGLEFTRGAAAHGGSALAAATGDGKIAVVPVSWRVRFDNGNRVVTPSLGEAAVLVLDPAGSPALPFGCAADADGRSLAAAGQLADGTLAVVTRSVVENEMTGERQAEDARLTTAVPERLSRLVVDGERRNVFGGTPAGRLYWWRIDGNVLKTVSVASAGPSGITAMALLIGDRSLVVGQSDGSLSVWFPVRSQVGVEGLARVRDFPRLDGSVSALAPSARDKGFLAATDRGAAGLYYSTSERTLWTGRLGDAPVTALFYAPKTDGAFAAGGGRIVPMDIHDPHPEVSLKALFGKVWYEGAGGPAWVWQSSSGTDDFEPKLSLTPLLAGTLKGTFYSLLLAIPLAILSSIFASQFLDPALRRYVKPAVEVMASLPSVVLGFLAGLWLAPRVERALPGLILMAVVLPLLVLGAAWAWRRIPRRITAGLRSGSELFVYAVVIAAGASGCLALDPFFERWAFSGSFSQWLLGATGLPYDQRNAVVVGLAMGFAVIPIIFAIAEDALSNVPRSLASGALALGATRWQTVSRVVLPAASPGIFAAVMVGFGRAVGETMIVLMATGNTPIMDWSPFNGFRTLSANIAVEVPEAPFGGTLYRTLFLAALLLFAMTFAVNTAAEVVRQRLRRRYARF